MQLIMKKLFLILALVCMTISQAWPQAEIVDDTPPTQLVNGSNTFSLTSTGHIQTHASGTPTMSPGTCGTSPSINSPSSDLNGSLTTGGGAFASCVVLLANTYSNAPNCVCNVQKTIAQACSIIATTSTLSIFGPTSATPVNWICMEPT